MATVSKYRKANPRDRLLGPSSTTFTFSMVPNLLNALWRSASVVLKLRPNTPMQLVGAGFSRSPLVCGEKKRNAAYQRMFSRRAHMTSQKW